jgi:hypothetical protein
MSLRITPPKIDPRKANDLLRALHEMAPHYTREWPAKDDDDPGVALLKIFSFISEGVISRLNRAPERNFLAFLDMLGIRLLQARPARAPIQFVLTAGAEAPVLVRPRTQVTAPPTEERQDDLPFETLSSLLVVPSAITSLIAVDPEKDSIYKPPPGFFALTQSATKLPELMVTAFSAAQSKFLQLDPPDQVKKGEFLRIDQTLTERSGVDQCIPLIEESESRQSEHMVVSADAKGSVVTLTDPLSRDYGEGTRVRRVTQFELFEGRNWQEHILYLGHSEYFAIESEAQLTVRVQHAPGVSSNLQSLNVVWEFFSEIDKVEDWFPFQVDVDGTQGFSRNGDVVLTKPKAEIKETEINGQQNRWIRARLAEPLPATPRPELPKIELINLMVAAGKELPPDNAFSNDTPLTTDVPFFPFGAEPRLFDRFSIASEEAFSKPNTEIELDFEIDTTELLASPAAVFVDGQVRVFARAVGGRLQEFLVDPGTSTVNPDNHASPGDIRLTAGFPPAVVSAPSDDIGVFVRGDDGNIHVRFIPAQNNDPAKWHTLSATPGTLQFSPAAIESGGTWRIFAVADNRLYRTDLTPATVAAAAANSIIGVSWSAIPGAPEINSTPVIVGVAGSDVLFVTAVDGHLHSLSLAGNTWTDRTLALPPGSSGFLAAPNARPHVFPYTDLNGQQFRAFLRNKDDQLIAIDTAAGLKNFPPLLTGVGSNPSRSADPLDHRIYVRGKEDNHLRVIEDLPGEDWDDLKTSGDINLNGDPFVLTYQSGTSVFTTSKRNALLEFRIQGGDLAAGKIEKGPREVMLLQAAPVVAGTYYIHITDGPGSTSDNDAVRKTNIPPLKTFIELDSPLDESATDDTEYDLLRQIADGDVQSSTNTTLELEAGHGNLVQPGDFVFVRGQIRRIPAAPAAGDEITISGSWDTNPTSADDYVLLRATAQGHKAAAASDVRLVLDPAVVAANNFYNNKFLQITSGPGTGNVGIRIDDYFNSTNNVVLHDPFPQEPTNTSMFRITATSIPEAWFVHQVPDQDEIQPVLSWEYWNGKSWLALTLRQDETRNLQVEGAVSFILPEDVSKTEVAGQENFWIRARIVSGDYGREIITVPPATGGEIEIDKSGIRPPHVLSISITYKLTEFKDPQICLTLNNLNYLDQTAANITENKNFHPFVPLDDTGKALYFGFNQALKGGPLRIYFAANELVVDERNKPKLFWQFAFENDWKELVPDDGTEGFTKPEYVSFNVPNGMQNSQEFGQALYWLRATLAGGDWSTSPLFSGVFLNTVEAMQVRTVREEILGSSVGVKNQKFKFQQTPVIEGEEVRVREALTEEERELLISAQGKDAIFDITDQQGRALETWIRWTEVIEFFDSNSTSRNYRLDRHTGEIEFGDGIHGRIPPAGGDNIRAFIYQAGGGAQGNVGPGEIQTAVTAVAGVDSVRNPVAAGGGSDAATNEDMLTIGPAQISHRDRAVTPDDFERLALEASREVRKARCLPNRNASGRQETGWTTVYIVPNSEEAKPVPTLALRRAVQRYLAARADVTVADQKHIAIGPPEYVPVTVEATIFAKSLDLVAAAEQQVKKQLEEFLHPLKGGPEKTGWEFGRDLAASDLYSLLEAIEEVDHVAELRLFAGDSSSDEQVVVGADALIAGGPHRITMGVSNGE